MRSRACRRSRSGNNAVNGVGKALFCSICVLVDVGSGHITFHDDFLDQSEVRLVCTVVFERIQPSNCSTGMVLGVVASPKEVDGNARAKSAASSHFLIDH